MKADSKIKSFFYPSSICVAGASSKEKSIGYEILRSIKEFGYTGKLFPVNPNSGSILGSKCFKTIEDIHEKIDLAIIVVPKTFAEDSVDSILKKGTKAIVLITAGFKETGSEGAVLENKILQKVNAAGARLVGPNCMGLINTLDEIKLNATFVAEKPAVGRTAFFSQSGAIGAAVLNSLRDTDIRFAHFISAGNKADISEIDILEFWQTDENISVMTFYLESFENGESFINKFIQGDITKPVIILKAGRSEEGIKAASSHTGALGSSDRVVNAALDQFGIIRAESLNELFNTSKGFENFALPKGSRIAVVTNAGGPAILAIDSIVKEKLTPAKLSIFTKKKLREIVRAEGSVENPVDLLPGGTPEQFKAVNEIAAADENVDAVISIFVEPVMVPAFDVIENINSIKSEKPIYQVVMPLPEFWEKYRRDSKYKIPLFRNPEEPAKVISNILFFEKRKVKRNYFQPGNSKIKSTDFITESSKRTDTGFIGHKILERITKVYNLPMIQSDFIPLEEITKTSLKINFPVVLKGISKKVIHKSELDAVKVNIKNKEELLLAAGSIKNNFEKNNIELEGFLIQPFIKPKHELLIGGFRDKSFGPMIMFGGGGKYVEVYDDTCLKSACLCDDDIEEMIKKTKIGKILEGVRGEKPADMEKIKNVIRSSAQMMLDNPDIKEFDFNPLIVCVDDSISIVDARIKLVP